MGNYVSCTLANPHPKSSSKSTKVILPTGEIRLLKQPTKAAELMMEATNFFICNTKCLKIGRRFCALNADDDLEKGNVYAMFPMHRNNSVVSSRDMGALFLTANSVSKRASQGNFRVLPQSMEEVTEELDGDVVDGVPRLSLEGIEDVTRAEFRHRMSMSRSRKPLLQSIEEEEPTCSK